MLAGGADSVHDVIKVGFEVEVTFLAVVVLDVIVLVPIQLFDGRELEVASIKGAFEFLDWRLLEVRHLERSRSWTRREVIVEKGQKRDYKG